MDVVPPPGRDTTNRSRIAAGAASGTMEEGLSGGGPARRQCYSVFGFIAQVDRPTSE